MTTKRPNLWHVLGWLYESLFAIVPHRNLVRGVAEKLKTTDRVLDAGCGTGRLALYAPDTYIVGVDASPSMLRYAQRRCTYIKLGDLADLRFASNTFDKVISLNVLYAVEDPLAVLTEMRRVLRAGGTLVLATPITSALTPLLREHLDVATRREQGRFLLNLPRLVAWMAVLSIRGIASQSHFTFMSEPDLLALVQQAGFSIQSSVPAYAGIDRLVTATKEADGDNFH